MKEREEKTSTSAQEREGTLEKAHLEAFFFIRSFLSLRTAAAHLGPECQSFSLSILLFWNQPSLLQIHYIQLARTLVNLLSVGRAAYRFRIELFSSEISSADG